MQRIEQIRFHTRMSLIKSILRIVGFVFLLFFLPLGVILLIIAEVVGILEEKDEF